MVTRTSTTPAACAGVTAVSIVAETTTMLVAATPPMLTALAPVRLVPVTVIAWPPVSRPALGLTLVTVGPVIVWFSVLEVLVAE